MKKKSNVLFVILLLIFLVLLFDIALRIYVTKKFSTDASTINNLGIIRGSIQRVVKNELNDNESNGLISKVNSKIEIYSKLNNKFLLSDTGDFNRLFKILKKEWEEIKKIIKDYRNNSNQENKNKLYKKSEEIWSISNNVVSEAQLESEVKLKYSNYFIITSLISLILIILILLYVKLYVKDKLEILALHDPLTKAYNRNYFNDFLNNEMQRIEKIGEDLSLIMLDIDYFKKINDTYGHEKGDYVLIELVNIVKKEIRKNDVFARYGGEEFIIVMPEMDVLKGKEVAERIRKVVSNTKLDTVGTITISLGVTQHYKGDTQKTIINRVDKAMYNAKENGRNRVETVEIS